MTPSYTHVVIGAGCAGSVVAARISENEKYHVLLIEAGPDDTNPKSTVASAIHNAKKVPMRGQSSTFESAIDWDFTIEMPNAKSSMQIPQPRIVGGGSRINGGTALRSTEADSREWVELGNDSWDFESLYEVYQSLEDDEVRKTHGPHPLVRATEQELGRIQRAFLDGAIQSGFQRVVDLNAPAAEGVSASPVCRKDDKRISVANTFLDPVRGRKNFTLLGETQVDRVLFSTENPPKATGILLTTGQILSAFQEVIISAGALLSPAILQRSGIGSTDLLNHLSIPTLVNLPVGENLADHPCVPLLARPRAGAYSEDDYSLQMQARWSSTVLPGRTDLQLVAFSYLYASTPTENTVTQSRSLAGNMTGHVAGIGCNINKLMPASSGTVHICSKDPSELPRVTMNYLESAPDRALAREAVQKGFAVMTSEAMQAVLDKPHGITEETVKNDQMLDEFIRKNITSAYHFTSTCRMADRKRGGVVDQEGRVYGVSGLRVCDASILPTVPASNTMWTTVAFAERIGRWIRDAEE